MVDKYLDKAVEDYQTLISKYPEKRSYRVRMEEVNKAIGERNEKMKKDMIEKLKDLGNMCLRPFGLSTDNFELQQQPGGGYSINLKR
ncbi:unnamed protein product [Enterobius vermicularis]|uniref:Outer membrane protein assembly factor BamD n=1 Tax=Enterobius vermicularis TaxID=51028 RepID=A0A0N4UUZ8_ENTVE|nr:unnamed protein product [Enterobius vermicularis]